MKKVCIQGLGFVGAAMATAVAIAKDKEGSYLFNVIGIDLPNEIGRKRVEAINNGQFPFLVSDEKLKAAIAQAHSAGNLSATTDSKEYGDASIVIIDIPLDIPYLDDEPQLDFEGFKKAIRTIGQHIAHDTLIIVETTVPPGTCEKVVEPTLREELEKRKLDAQRVHVAHSYERVMPGNDYLSSIVDFWRVFAGNTKEAGDACEEFLSSVVNCDKYPLTRLSSTTASETAKVMENTYRATNIAFIDEWTKYAESIGIDLFEIIEAIRVRPTHSNIRFPGLGVGGYCLTKDPTFTPASSKQLFNKNLDFPFSNLAVRVNHDMPLHTVNRLKSLLGGVLEGKNILVCGVSYRQDVGDSRYSPTEVLVRELMEHNAQITCHDPYLTYWEEMEMELPLQLPETNGFDAVVVAVPHKAYQELNLVKWVNKSCLVLDANLVFNKQQRDTARDRGIRIESIGRGDGL